MRLLRMIPATLACLVFLSATARAEDLPLNEPWLQPALPAGTLAYFRVPHPTGLLSLPKGNALDAALRDPRHLKQLKQIERGFIDTVFGGEGFDIPFVRGLLQHTRSSIEVAVLGAPRPLGLVALTTDLDDEAALASWLESFGEAGTPLALGATLDADGRAPLLGLPVSSWIEFDVTSGRVLVVAGQVVNEDIMAGIEGRLTADNERLPAMAGRLDDSGYGVLFWINAEDALPMAQMMLPAEQYAAMAEAGLDDTRAVAVGMGVADGRARLGIVADLGAREDSPLPVFSNDLGATTVGVPGGVIFASIPGPEQVDTIAEYFAAQSGLGPDEDWAATKAEMRENVGFDTDLLLGALGPDLALIFDDVGDYLAMRIRDRKKFDALVEAINDFDSVSIDRVRRGRATLYHIISEDSMEVEEEMGEDSALPLSVVHIMQRMRDHYYFVIEGDYAYFSDIPQPLIDRAAERRKLSMGRWLEETQRVSLDSAAFAMTGSSAKLPRRLYYGYVGIMQIMADIAGVEFDALSLPTARELGLPAESPLAVTVSVGEPYVAFEITTESSLFDTLLGGGAAQNAAMIGIAAAIAIPAYQDYTIRSQISEGLSLASVPKAYIVESYYETGAFPNSEQALQAPRQTGRYVDEVVVFGDTGLIRVRYGGEEANEVINGDYLYVQPIIGDDGSIVDWECSSWIDDKYLPSDCRGIEPPDIAGEANTWLRPTPEHVAQQ
ncbi:MAG: pilin [Pseudomonadota bacterium]